MSEANGPFESWCLSHKKMGLAKTPKLDERIERMTVQPLQELEPKARPLAGYKVIDVDTHWSEPSDLWISRAPAAFRDIVPQVHMKDGLRWWYIDGKPFGPVHHSSAIRSDGEKLLGMDFWDLEWDEVHPGSHDVAARLAVMDQAGIQAQIVYPNVLGFGNTKAIDFSLQARLIASQIYNDAAAEMQEQSGNRLFPMIMTPWWDIDEAIKEIRRGHAMGLRGINTNSDPQDAGLPDLSQDYWNPLWETCIELDLPINFHIGSSQTQNMWYGKTPWPTLPKDPKLIVGGTMLFAGNCGVICNIVMSDLLDRYPALKFVSVESGIGWVPYLMDALDYGITQASWREGSHGSMKPSEYFRRNFSFCFWFEVEGLRHTVDRIGIDSVMWESDYPHPTCLFPELAGNRRTIAGQFQPG